MRGMAEFRVVLHEWTARQLENRSQHTGPFTVERVWFEYDEGFSTGVTFEDDTLNICIAFKHDQHSCGDVKSNGTPCMMSVWRPFDSPKRTVDMLNELLAIDS